MRTARGGESEIDHNNNPVRQNEHNRANYRRRRNKYFSDESKTSSKPKIKINENEMKTILDETSSAGCTHNNNPVPHDHFHSGQSEKNVFHLCPLFERLQREGKKQKKNGEKTVTLELR